jgi:N utilization substance protein B
MEVTGDSPPVVLRAEDAEQEIAPGVRQYAALLLELVTTHRDTIDGAITRHARTWSLERLAATDRAVLRLAVAELLHQPDVPAEVIIDEAIEIARRFGNPNSGGFVNGVLDAIWHEAEPPASGEA